jgi:hypothetical protein
MKLVTKRFSNISLFEYNYGGKNLVTKTGCLKGTKWLLICNVWKEKQ